ncbi:MliC family protein [Paracoccus cavernae]|uniref:MliC family protein n=1 Tax=Paracoccus cavernae TaxID=1571207 RepID=A0ABT8D473_9RHOB|nr:MliC family protein [Paracoccus cavernae]
MIRSALPALSALVLGLVGGAASAEVAVTIPLEVGPTSSVLTATYSCAGGEPFAVQYVNAGANALALLPVDGDERVFVNVVSASGARYASGPYIWWSKGDSATLENEMEDGSLTECTSTDYPAAE